MTRSPDTPAPKGADERASLALAVSECEDEIAAREQAARRHLLWSLLPGVGLTSFWIVCVLLGVGSPAGVLSTIFGIVTAREGKKQYDHRLGLSAARARLAEIVSSTEEPHLPGSGG